MKIKIRKKVRLSNSGGLEEEIISIRRMYESEVDYEDNNDYIEMDDLVFEDKI
ncbi:MAG: hypothetical protein ACOCUR_01860 [Nanoarchaeota archaeon]